MSGRLCRSEKSPSGVAATGSVTGFATKRVLALVKPIEQLIDIGMTDRAVLAVGHQVLLADIGRVIAV